MVYRVISKWVIKKLGEYTNLTILVSFNSISKDQNRKFILLLVDRTGVTD